MLTFEQFRLTHDEALRRQREHLRDDAVAERVLGEGNRLVDWIPWGDAAKGWAEWPDAVQH